MHPLGDSDPRTVGPYRLLAELGRGGMGRVLLGAASDGKLVAVKQIRPTLVEEDGFVARFRREVAASRRVSGAHTAAVVDADVSSASPWLASVFVPGPSLQEAAVLPEDAVLRLAAGLAAALAEIHRAGLVHRDLKPTNVLLAEDGPRVIDFGIARAVDGEATEVTRTGWLIGSPGFMSPEQAEARALTPASDVFSLGCLLFMACTGDSPFAGASAPRTLYNVVHTQPDLTAVPSRVRGIVAQCLAKDPAARPTPERLLASLAPVVPAPWPPVVHTLTERQRAEIGQLLTEVADDATVVVLAAVTVVLAKWLPNNNSADLTTRAPGSELIAVKATRARCRPWRSARTAACSSPQVRTGWCGCGTSRGEPGPVRHWHIRVRSPEPSSAPTAACW